MSSSERGARFEKIVEAQLREALASRRLGLLPESATVYRHKSYFSKDRNDVIIIDVSIEIVLPDAPTWSILWAWECKDYERPVEVGKIEEFHSKLLQIAGANVKGGFASAGPLQRAALEYAKSKGIAVGRFTRKSMDFLLYCKVSPIGREVRQPTLEEICDDEITDERLDNTGIFSYMHCYGISSQRRPYTTLMSLVEEEIEESINAIPQQPSKPFIDNECAVERIARWLGERPMMLNDRPISCSYVEKILGLPENSGPLLIPLAAARFKLSLESQSGDFIVLARKK